MNDQMYLHSNRGGPHKFLVVVLGAPRLNKQKKNILCEAMLTQDCVVNFRFTNWMFSFLAFAVFVEV